MTKWLIFFALAVVIGVPFAVRPPEATAPKGAERLVIITPHIEPIRVEFSRGFDEWHRRNFGTPAVIDWRVPGGTSDIQKQLKAVYEKAITSGQLLPSGELATGFPPMPFDLFFGGGTYEHGETKKGVKARPPSSDKDISLSMSVSAGLAQAALDECFGENALGSGFLYDPPDSSKNDPGQFWIGTAASGFGIVYNRDLLETFNLPEPDAWEDLCAPGLTGWIALADPRQSGSVATLYDSVLNNHGWEKGWRILREMGANARYFTNSSPKVPIDVSQGEAVMGVAISHYGRYQAQMVMRAGETPETSRVGYVDPPGVVYVDADPISLMRGGSNPVVARRFIDFCLSEEGQALWQFHARESADGLGPHQFELRRMPLRRSMYTKYRDRMIDKVSPFEIASTVKEKGWRSAVAPMMGAFAIDTHSEIKRAWDAMNAARARGAPAERLAAIERAFYAFPDWIIDGKPVPFTEANYKAIRAAWKDAESKGEMPAIKAAWISFFRHQYAEVERLAAP